MALASSVIIGRLFGAEAVGTYYIVVALVSIASMVGRLGMDLPITRLVSVAVAQEEWARSGGVLRAAFRIAAPCCAVLTVLWFLAAPSVAPHFGGDSFTAMLRLAAIGILPWTMTALYGRGLVAAGRPSTAEFIEFGAFHIVFVLLAVSGSLYLDTLAIGLAFAGSYWLTFLAMRWQWSTTRASKRSGPRMTTADLLRPSIPMLFTGSIRLVIAWTDILMIGLLLGPVEAGIYGAAFRVSGLLTFLVAATASVANPRLASLHANADLDALGVLARRIARWTGLAAIFPALAIIVLAGPILAVFGPEFRAGATVLTILVVGQLVNASTGLVGGVLAMAGKEKRILHAVIASAIANLGLNILLIPTIGMEGAAIAATVSLMLINGLYLLFVRRDLGVSAWPAEPRKLSLR